MFFGDHAQLGLAAKIPVPDPSPVLSYSPVVLNDIPNRPAPLQMRVSVPSSSSKNGEPLPIILLSHGLGPSSFLSSHEGYAPLADFLAGRGFAVIQPTHLYSRSYDPAKLSPAAEEGNEFHWKTAVQDLTTILDRLDEIEAAVPLGLVLDRKRIGIVGHSFGASIASLPLGVLNADPRFPDAKPFGGRDARIKAGVLMAGAGSGPLETEMGRKMLPFYAPDFGQLSAPTLVVAGELDASPHLTTTRGPEFHMDAYHLAPGPKDLLTVKGGLHCLGGVDGWDAVGTPEDASPQRLGLVQRMTWAYLRSQLYEGDMAWADACKALKGLEDLGDVQHKS
ncbi:alpha/beta-hydrolase [Apiospora arundinis]|uniref:Alpha/beta-hydrolase n=1 Tax=Apiospora arundinis TaxID=335852 RepID=A0ABR2HLB1_9PEZI